MSEGQKKRAKTAEVIQALIERDGDFCQFYDCPFDRYEFTKTNFRTIDHVIPRAAGGTDTMDNYVLMHFKCNNKKGSRLYREDGTLEPLPEREPKSTVVKRPPCETCNEGRILLEGEVCPDCGSGPQPLKFPKYKQRSPKECDHKVFFCWACTLGFTPRADADEDVFWEESDE